ncbi:MAG: thioredoxin [Candidatus Hydrothermarchaeaceae archaeon]
MDELEKIRLKKRKELMAKMASKTNVLEQPSKPVVLDDGSFDDFVKKYPLSLVDCWAAWCAPCRILAPTIDALAAELKGKVVFGKLNVDENPKTAARFGIRSIPTMLVFKNGGLVDQLLGALPKENIKGVVLNHV